MPQVDLVLVHSFPTNSILLRGLVDFLEDYFTVHFVDLPGFTRRSPPLERVSIEAYAEFLGDRIQRLDLKRYILGGISFGYLVVSCTRVDARCQAIFAIEPFLGVRSLRMGRTKRLLFGLFTRAVVAFGLCTKIFHGRLWRKRLLRRGDPEDRVDTVLREIDPRTFIATASLLVTYRRDLCFHDLPHVLMVNPHDGTIDANDVLSLFRSEVENLLVVETTVEHYPRSITKQYFQEHISSGQMEQVFEFLRGVRD